MLTVYELMHTAPAFLFAYAGVRCIFNHDVALYFILTVAAVITVGTIVFPPRIAHAQNQRLLKCRQSQSKERILENLDHVKSMPSPKGVDATRFLESGCVKAPDVPFKDH